MSKTIALLRSTALAGAFVAASAAGALADDFSSADSYNHGYGMGSGQENAAVTPSIRDANGNLTVVNGQFQSSQFASTGVQSMSASGTSLAGMGRSSGAAYGGATAIGNQLNVVTVGNWNTVIVDSTQINHGDQTAETKIDSH